AEDGIRDFHVTGVQTCALPICADDVARLDAMHVADLDPVGLHPRLRRFARRLGRTRGARGEVVVAATRRARATLALLERTRLAGDRKSVVVGKERGAAAWAG